MIIQNAVYVPSADTYYVSSSRNSYVTFKVSTSKDIFFIDGGQDYCRRNFTTHPDIKDFNIYDTSSDDEIYERLLWGSRGPMGKDPLHYRLVKDLETDHMKSILSTQHQIDQHVRDIIVKSLIKRGEVDNGK